MLYPSVPVEWRLAGLLYTASDCERDESRVLLLQELGNRRGCVVENDGSRSSGRGTASAGDTGRPLCLLCSLPLLSAEQPTRKR